MRYLAVLATIVLAGVAAAPGGAGGWATVGFEPLPDDVAAGTTWSPTIFVKQHGVTPLSGLRPVVTIEDSVSGRSLSFDAVPSSEAGVYEADIVFPTASTWRVAITSGFGDSNVTYGPVSIGAVPAGGDGSFPNVALGVVASALVLAAAVAFGARRLRRLTPASR